MSERAEERGESAGREGAPEPRPDEDAGAGGDDERPSRGRRRRTVREERLGGKPRGQEFRVPAWVVIPLAAGAGYFVSGPPGAVFGRLVGLVLWWSRR